MLKDFPQNIALLNLIDQKTKLEIFESHISKSSGKKQEQSLQRKSLTQDLDMVINENIFNRKKSKNSSKHNELSKRLVTGSTDTFEREGLNELICSKHHKKLEVICTEPECQLRVCYQCGLFGEHSVSLKEPSSDSRQSVF